jgi:hypothetical protein
MYPFNGTLPLAYYQTGGGGMIMIGSGMMFLLSSRSLRPTMFSHREYWYGVLPDDAFPCMWLKRRRIEAREILEWQNAEKVLDVPPARC